MNKYITQLKESAYFRRSVILVSGTALAQILAILFQLLLRRIFSPEVFGAYAVYLSTFSILAVLTSFKYEMAIVLPRKDKHGAGLFFLSVILNVIFAAVLLGVFFLFQSDIARLIRLDSEYSSWLPLMPLALLFFGLQKTINSWLIRKKKFRQSSINKVVRRGGEGVSQSVLGYGAVSSGLVLGQIIGNFLYAVVGFYQLVKLDFFKKQVGANAIRYVARRYLNFPKFQAFPHLLNTFSLMIPVVIVNVLYDQATTGYFDLTRQVLALPLALISVALAQIILQDVSERRNSGKLVNRQITNTFLVLVLISIPGVILILLFGETLFGYIFGDEWTMSGKIAQVLVFSYAVKFVVSPLSSVLTALEKLKIMALWRVLYFLAIVSLFFLRNIDAMIFFQVYMILEVTFYVIYFIIILASGLSYDKKIQQNMDSVPK